MIFALAAIFYCVIGLSLLPLLTEYYGFDRCTEIHEWLAVVCWPVVVVIVAVVLTVRSLIATVRREIVKERNRRVL